MTIAQLGNIEGIKVIEKSQRELYSLSVIKGDVSLFCKNYIICPHENIRNVKELVLAHCLKSLQEQGIINN